jgi:hypothetical protein
VCSYLRRAFLEISSNLSQENAAELLKLRIAHAMNFAEVPFGNGLLLHQ